MRYLSIKIKTQLIYIYNGKNVYKVFMNNIILLYTHMVDIFVIYLCGIYDYHQIPDEMLMRHSDTYFRQLSQLTGFFKLIILNVLLNCYRFYSIYSLMSFNLIKINRVINEINVI